MKAIDKLRPLYVIKKILPFFFMGFLLCLLFYKVIFFKEVYYTGDNFHLNVPEKYFLVDQIKQGIFPLWNPYIFIGVPYIADLNLGTFYPLNFIYFLFPVPQALTIVSIIDIFLIASFQYIFLRSMRISRTGSLFGSVIFAFGGMPFIFITNVTLLNVTVYVPLLFFFLFRFVQNKNIKCFLLFILLQALQILSGHPQITYYTIIFLSIFLFFWSNFSWKAKLFLYIVYVLCIFLLSSVVLLPFLEYVMHATRPLANIQYASSGSLSLYGFITFIFPTFFGTYIDGTWWGPQLMLSGYIGIPSFIFLVVGLIKEKLIKKSYFIFSLFLSLLLALGKISPVYLFFYYIIPGWKLFRNPNDMIVFFTFFAATLSSVGFDYVQKNPTYLKNISKRLLPFLLPFFILFCTIYVICSIQKYFWENVFLFLSQKTHIVLINRILFYTAQKIQVMFQGITVNIILMLMFFMISLCLFVLLSKNIKVVRFLFVVLICVNLIYFDSKLLLTTSSSFYDNAFHKPISLFDVRNGEYRVLSLSVNLHQDRRSLAAPNYFYQEGLANFAVFHADNNIQSGIYQADGYASLVPNSYAYFISHNNSTNTLTGIDFTKVTTRQLNTASIKYIISHEPITPFSRSLRLIDYKPGKYYIYQNAKARKRVFTLSEQTGDNVQLIQTESALMTMKVHTTKPNQLIFSSWFYPGWQAEVNGKNTPIISYADTFQSVSIPKGTSIVSFTYHPFLLYIGAIISVCTLLLLGVFCLLIRRVLL